MQFTVNGRTPLPPEEWDRLLPKDAGSLRILLEGTTCSTSVIRSSLRQLSSTRPLARPDSLEALLEQRRTVAEISRQQLPLIQYLDHDACVLMLEIFLGRGYTVPMCREDQHVMDALRAALQSEHPAANEAVPWIHAMYYLRTPCRGKRMRRPLSTRDYCRLTAGKDADRLGAVIYI